MLSRLADWLHPNGWSTDEVFDATVRFAAILGLALACAWASAPLLRRWLRPRPGAAGNEQGERAVRALRGAIVCLGLYEAMRGLPLHHGSEAISAGILFVIAVMLAARVVIHTAGLGLHRYVDRTGDAAARERVQRDYLPLASTATTVGVTLIAVIFIAHHFGHDVTSLVTAFGVSSLAIGLAAQATLGNTIAGFILLVDRPFRPGDRIRLQSGESGEIQAIGIRSTRILLPEGNQLIVPNAELANSRVVNLSYPRAQTRGEVRVRVAASAIETVTQTLLELAAAEPQIGVAVAAYEDTAPPSVGVTALDGRAAELTLRFAVATGERGKVEERLRRALAARLRDSDHPPATP